MAVPQSGCTAADANLLLLRPVNTSPGHQPAHLAASRPCSPQSGPLPCPADSPQGDDRLPMMGPARLPRPQHSDMRPKAVAWSARDGSPSPVHTAASQVHRQGDGQHTQDDFSSRLNAGTAQLTWPAPACDCNPACQLTDHGLLHQYDGVQRAAQCTSSHCLPVRARQAKPNGRGHAADVAHHQHRLYRAGKGREDRWVKGGSRG